MLIIFAQNSLFFAGITGIYFGEGEGPIHMDNVECLGVESSIMECVFDIHTADCSHSQDVGVSCYSCEHANNKVIIGLMVYSFLIQILNREWI